MDVGESRAEQVRGAERQGKAGASDSNPPSPLTCSALSPTTLPQFSQGNHLPKIVCREYQPNPLLLGRNPLHDMVRQGHKLNPLVVPTTLMM